MYSPGTVNNSTMAMPMMPPNFCHPPVYGNFPFHPPFGPPFYPPCNYYNNPSPYNPPISQQNGSHVHTDLSQPPPGYVANAPMPRNFGSNNAMPPPTPFVHMANVRANNFAGYPTPNAAPMVNGNQFNRPPPPVSPAMNRPTNNSNRSSSQGNNRANSEARVWPYFCKSCDRGFTSMNKYKEHTAQHQTCGIEGCTFSAHEKLIQKHIEMQHRTPGLFNRIVKGYSPEEIQKWISERKKHFPTQEKIVVREAQREEMQRRGERYAERRGQFNQRNPNFRRGQGNRFNRNAPNRNGRFGNRPYGNGGRRNAAVNRTATDENDQPRNTRKRMPAMQEEADGQLRKLLPFRGTAYYQHLENISQSEGEHEEHTITDDDDNVSIWSDDDDIKVIDCIMSTGDKNVIAELEKSCETSQPGNSEQDCLDIYFKNCDNVDETDKAFNDRDVPDENMEKSDHSDIKDDPKIQTDPITVDSSVCDKPPVKAMNSLALLQCYDSDNDSNDEGDDATEQDNSETNPSSDKVVSAKKHSNGNEEPEERPSKRICTGDVNPETSSVNKFETEKNNHREDNVPEKRPFELISDSDEDPEIDESLGKFETKKNNQSSDDSGPDECSSKRISTEENNNLEVIKPSSINENLIGNAEPIACSSKNTDEAETNNSVIDKAENDDEETKGCESKKRKRKRRRDGNDEIECDEETDKKPVSQSNVPRMFYPPRRYKLTLLEKLLSSEIKHERNVILQCVRYTVDNNYFLNSDVNNSS